MYAIIETGGKQYKAAPGETIKVEKLEGEPGTVLSFDKVVAVFGDKATVGAPYVAGAKVTGEVVSTYKGDKVLVYKKRPRRVYEKLRGHRQMITAVKITDVQIGG